jgi:hypothetical protein
MKSSHVSIMLAMIFVLAACVPGSNTEENRTQSDPTEHPLAAALIWERTGGIAGFCDMVIIYQSGATHIANCKGDIVVRSQLTEGQRVQLDGWLKTLKPIDYYMSDPAVADNMTISLHLAGEGSQKVDDKTLGSIFEFAADIASQAEFDAKAPPEKDEAEQALREYLSALNEGDFILGAKLYGGTTDLLQVWNPDITNDLPALLKRACTQNGLVCMIPLSIAYRGIDANGSYQFRVEFSNPDGSLFVQGPCCGDENGPSVTSFLFRVVKAENGYVVLDLPPYVP